MFQLLILNKMTWDCRLFYLKLSQLVHMDIIQLKHVYHPNIRLLTSCRQKERNMGIGFGCTETIPVVQQYSLKLQSGSVIHG